MMRGLFHLFFFFFLREFTASNLTIITTLGIDTIITFIKQVMKLKPGEKLRNIASGTLKISYGVKI